MYVIVFPDDKIKVLNMKPEENTREEQWVQDVNNKLWKKVMQKEGIIDGNFGITVIK